MAHELEVEKLTREEIYQALLPQLRSMVDAEIDLIANLANLAAALKTAFEFHWVGFYRRIDQSLVLGPFQGPPACTRIPLGKGVCGTAAAENKILIVPNVDEFPGHIACSNLSRSEIVIPLVHAGETKLILDIDSSELDDFSETDSAYLTQILDLIKKKHTI